MFTFSQVYKTVCTLCRYAAASLIWLVFVPLFASLLTQLTIKQWATNEITVVDFWVEHTSHWKTVLQVCPPLWRGQPLFWTYDTEN